MKKVYIIGLIFLATAAFSMEECKECTVYHPFPFSKLPTIIPEYLTYMIMFFSLSALVWIMAMEAKEYRFEMKVAAILMTGRFIDYFLRGGEWWHFTIGRFIFSYNTFAFFAFAVLVIVNYRYQLWNSG